MSGAVAGAAPTNPGVTVPTKEPGLSRSLSSPLFPGCFSCVDAKERITHPIALATAPATPNVTRKKKGADRLTIGAANKLMYLIDTGFFHTRHFTYMVC
jgi:hypothetical protein